MYSLCLKAIIFLQGNVRSDYVIAAINTCQNHLFTPVITDPVNAYKSVNVSLRIYAEQPNNVFTQYNKRGCVQIRTAFWCLR